MKRIIPTILIVAIFTLVFIFCFRSCAYATGYGQDALIDATKEDSFLDNNSEVTTENTAPNTSEYTDIVDDTANTDTTDTDTVNTITEELDFKTYIQEKIIPVVIGVLTASSALIATLASISRSLGKIKDAREDFKKEAGKREESFKAQSELLKTKAEELLKIASELPKLKSEIGSLQKNTEKLILECSYISKMISLGFGESKEVVKSGSGAKISRLEGECARLLTEGGIEANEKA